MKYVLLGVTVLVTCTVGIGFRIFTALSAKLKEASERNG